MRFSEVVHEPYLTTLTPVICMFFYFISFLLLYQNIVYD